jgi:hypothetical protein
MAAIANEGNEIHAVGESPAIGSVAPALSLADCEMKESFLRKVCD